MMKKVGQYGFDFDEKDYYCVKNNNQKIFYKNSKIKEILEKEELENWALVLNSPWSNTSVHYSITKNGFAKCTDEETEWKCEYQVVGYDGIAAICIGYGKTEEEALIDCKNLFKYLQETYNPNNNYF